MRRHHRAMILSVIASASIAGGPATPAEFEAGTAITDPSVLFALETAEPGSPGFRIDALVAPNGGKSVAIRNDNLFRGALSPIARSLIHSIDTLPEQSLDNDAKAVFKNGGSPDFRFSSRFIVDKSSTFQLVGVINRMDRAYRIIDGHHKKIDNCGEIRFIYRFTYDVVTVDNMEITSRLPITFNVVLNAKDASDPTPCSVIAKRWLDAGAQTTTGKPLADFLRSASGPLGNINPSLVDRIEVNFQMLRLPVSSKPDMGGHAEYLLKIFRRSGPTKPFLVTYLENEIDRTKLQSDPALLGNFKKWLFRPASIAALDQGILDIPTDYLATEAKSISPAGPARSENQPSFGLMSDEEIQAALDQYLATGAKLKTVQSVGGFKKRLDDFSCNGCHQTRAIAGFHFPGADRAETITANSVHIPGSAHFFADIPRRRAVIEAFAQKKPVDYSRGFSGRPLDRYKTALAGTQLFDGWGAVCYIQPPDGQPDKSFSSWTCGTGLECRDLHGSDREPSLGVCVTAGERKIGDPLEFGRIETGAFGNDNYSRIFPKGDGFPMPPEGRSDYVASHQEFRASDSSGGFPAGMLRIDGCENLPGEAKCGRVAATGFNKCISDGRPFQDCLKLTKTAGLRACDRANPCRQDYICTDPYADLPGDKSKGTCIPPYFVFQFRVDGHPSSFGEPNPD
ncbi:hypothetical protein SAMN05519104_5647 [Rhizobiales bacterium GAS188]|nr:hypothetical protein SAMN05519104_5647 [Rhizobiales bacterium GAS188]